MTQSQTPVEETSMDAATRIVAEHPELSAPRDDQALLDEAIEAYAAEIGLN